jgi:dipeptidyl-peptidase-4
MPRACRTLLFLIIGLAAPAQELTLAAIFGPHGLAGPAPQQLRWSPDGTVLTYILEEAGSRERNLWAVDVDTGGRQILVSHLQLSSLAPALREATGDERARERRRRYAIASYLWSPDLRSLLFTSAGSLFLYDLERSESLKLTRGLTGVKHPKFSPDGKSVSFVYEYDLWLASVVDGGSRRLTTGGTGDLLHGDLDWVYPEEFGVRSGYFWSPDSERIAFLETDQSGVPTYPMTTLTGIESTVDLQHYPKAGDLNPKVQLGIVEVCAALPSPSGWSSMPSICHGSPGPVTRG